ncbi:MAG: S49 family peptidase [Vicingus serpentipes]|nr:S49 family peptidase [Vicingus serpentipes]
MSFKTVSAILRGAWMIEPNYAQAHLPLVQTLLEGKLQGFQTPPQKIDFNASHPGRALFQASRFQGIPLDNLTDFPEGTTLVIPFSGPVMRDDYCGDLGTESYTALIKKATLLPNIESIILSIDSPGGQCSGTQMMVEAIKNCSKPIIAFINDGMAASAGYWIASACDEIYVSNKSSEVGSIGTLCQIADWEAYYEKDGLKIHTIYAPQSKDKNRPYKDAREGDYKLITEDLKILTDHFIDSVKESRGNRLNTSKENPFTGKMYFAEEAEAIGLIDGIKSLEDAFERAAEIVANKNSNQSKNKMKTKKYAAINAVLEVESLEAAEEGVFLNEDQLDAIEAGLTTDETLVTAEDHQTVVNELAEANTSIERNEATLRSIAEAAGVELAEGEEFNAETVSAAIVANITDLKASGGASHTSTDGAGDENGDEDPMAEIKNRDYYKDANAALANS